MKISTNFEDDVLVAVASGRLDGATSRGFEDDIKSAIGDRKCSVVLDFEDLEYISSAGLRVVLLLAKTVDIRGAKLALCTLPDSIMSVFQISGFDRIIPISSTRAEALKAVG